MALIRPKQALLEEEGRDLHMGLAQGRKPKEKAHGGGSASQPALPRTEEKGWDCRCPDGAGRSSAKSKAPSSQPSPVLSPGFEPSVPDPHSNHLIFYFAIKLETNSKKGIKCNKSQRSDKTNLNGWGKQSKCIINIILLSPCTSELTGKIKDDSDIFQKFFKN